MHGQAEDMFVVLMCSRDDKDSCCAKYRGIDGDPDAVFSSLFDSESLSCMREAQASWAD